MFYAAQKATSRQNNFLKLYYFFNIMIPEVKTEDTNKRKLQIAKAPA